MSAKFTREQILSFYKPVSIDKASAFNEGMKKIECVGDQTEP
jgi:hypothetical protein